MNENNGAAIPILDPEALARAREAFAKEADQGELNLLHANQEVCSKCKFAFSIGLRGTTRLWECRRNSPQVTFFLVNNGRSRAKVTGWPEVESLHWCGDWAVKE